MSEFTKGKWKVLSPLVQPSMIFVPSEEQGGNPIVVAFDIHNPFDARLIAAAPEMFELLRVCIKKLHSSDDSYRRIEQLLERIHGDMKGGE